MIYSYIMYRIDRGELKGYEAHTVELNMYDEANYQWVNDLTITFTLRNKYRNSKTYIVAGYGRSTSISVD